MKGNVFDIKKFAVHDGPGIRSTLFLKGCHLNCIWCQNPEGIKNQINLWYFERKCIQCNLCLNVCPNQALTLGKENESYISINHNKCDNNGACVNVCPTTALTFDGYEMEVDEAVEKLLQDKAFYDKSGGGITISGGDSLYQYKFSRAVLEKCKEHGVHTAIETCMYAKKEIFESFIGLVDLFIVDLKLFDENEHFKYVGTGNELILSNFKSLANNKQNILVRIPLIPGITAKEKNIRSICRFVFQNSPGTEMELINFNPLAQNKYRLMGKDYDFMKKMKPYTREELDCFYSILKEEGIGAKRETDVS
ncbi:MAG: glycyl-radical enzyme activating protein [Spirochaetaceae bacterium]